MSVFCSFIVSIIACFRLRDSTEGIRVERPIPGAVGGIRKIQLAIHGKALIFMTPPSQKPESDNCAAGPYLMTSYLI